MQPLKKRVESLQIALRAATKQLRLDEKVGQLAALEEEISAPEIWNNPRYAQEKTQAHAALAAMVTPWQTITVQVNDILELMELGDDSLLAEFEGQVTAL